MIIDTKTTMFPMIDWDIHKQNDNKYLLTANNELVAVRTSKKEIEDILKVKTAGIS